MAEFDAKRLMALAQAEILTREALADLVRFRESKGESGQVHALVQSAMERLERASRAFERVESGS